MHRLYHHIITLTILALAILFSILSHAQAAPLAQPEVECEVWATVPPWTVTRCADEWAGEVCLISSSGMMVCKFD